MRGRLPTIKASISNFAQMELRPPDLALDDDSLKFSLHGEQNFDPCFGILSEPSSAAELQHLVRTEAVQRLALSHCS